MHERLVHGGPAVLRLRDDLDVGRLGNIPKLRSVTQYLPDQVGMVIMHITGPQTEPRWARDYGPWTGIGLLALWAAAALIGGYLVLRRRDA
ncbi:hypothetical protein [Planotetraspora mira]|uniref:Uncharacterized protein n=1 Tax=Planotetraspora mira TaxID=58121 RepID=A0A8J3TMN6_9ACTN|nr:hypothetical protein [Planotetraspora mira]GII28631.1 hypothetical protein Pmi06nite_20730 [Planotetraspora mira]